MRTGTIVITWVALSLMASTAVAQDDGGDDSGTTDFSEVRAQSVDEPSSKDEASSGTPGGGGLSPIDGVIGHLGLGYFTGFAPIGVRYWTDRSTGFDIGFDAAVSSGDLESYRVGAEVGYLMGLAHYHYSVVFGRLGAGYRYLDTFGAHSGTARQDAHVNAFVGAELFLGAFGFPNVSLQGGYGFEASWVIQGGSKFLAGTTTTGLSVTGTGQLGFHIYL